jgi:hypothetical protein
MDGSSEAGPSSSAAPRVSPPRTQSDSVTQDAHGRPIAHSSVRRGNSDGMPSRASTIGAREHGPSRLGESPEEGETWQDFLRRAAPQDVIDRDPSDPVRQAYVNERKARALEEARKRRRAVSSLSNRASQMPPPLSRQHSSSLSTPRSRTSNTAHGIPHQSPTSMNRRLPRLPSFENTPGAPSSEYVVPRWQPDYETSSCPICGRTFGLFFRRHHCRKCGRVVCANCSPHRITIPRQFIVHPPVDPASQQQQPQSVSRAGSTEVIDLTGEETTSNQADEEDSESNERNPALGGGQEVRLCNPCVPDPNPLPPPTYPVNAGIFSSFPAPNVYPGPVHQRAGGYDPSRSDVQRSWENFAADVANLVGPYTPAETVMC